MITVLLDSFRLRSGELCETLNSGLALKELKKPISTTLFKT